MIFYCPHCAGCLEMEMDDYVPSKRIKCPYDACQAIFACSEILPYCYACGSLEIVAWIPIPKLGWLYGCQEHAANLKEFWLLSWIQFSIASAQHAREWSGGPIQGHGGGSRAFMKAAGQ